MPVTRSEDMKELELLPWDSEHFGFPVARLWGMNIAATVLREMLRAARQQGVYLVYWAADPKLDVPGWLLSEFCGSLVDQRATFECRLELIPHDEISTPSPYEVSEIPRGRPCRRLLGLALEAGAQSRFRSDPRITADASHRLYEVWITRSTLRELADSVLVISRLGERDNPLGMVTLSLNGATGRIGLIAVAEKVRGAGLGSRLLSAAHGWLLHRGVQTCSVVTQFANRPACRFYEKCGYQFFDLKSIYHFWPQETI
jgi:dTDP-4-amino-4,6-dideoxy-D-galactose acyltransferase